MIVGSSRSSGARRTSDCSWSRTCRGSRGPWSWTSPEHAGWQPVELFGRSGSPPSTRTAGTPLTLAPHAFLWFELTPPAAGEQAATPVPAPHPSLGPSTAGRTGQREPLHGGPRLRHGRSPRGCREQSWFHGTVRTGVPVEVVDVHAFGEHGRAALVFVRPADARWRPGPVPAAARVRGRRRGRPSRSPGRHRADRHPRARWSMPPTRAGWDSLCCASSGRRRELRGVHGAISADEGAAQTSPEWWTWGATARRHRPRPGRATWCSGSAGRT